MYFLVDNFKNQGYAT